MAQSYAFKVCRIEPENNVHLVLGSFAELPSYPFVVVGNWRNNAYGRQLREEFAAYPNRHLIDPIYDQAQFDVLRSNCYVHVHGHSAGGTNPSLVEAMSLGLPVLAFGVSFNKATTEHKALYFDTKTELMHLINSTRIDTWKALGEEMRAVADRRYNWAVIARKYNYLINRVFLVARQASKTGLHLRLS